MKLIVYQLLLELLAVFESNASVWQSIGIGSVISIYNVLGIRSVVKMWYRCILKVSPIQILLLSEALTYAKYTLL